MRPNLQQSWLPAAAVAALLTAALVLGAPPLSRGAAAERRVVATPSPDTVVVWGPVVVRVERGGDVLRVERVKLPGLADGRRYAVVLERTGSDPLPDSVLVRLDGRALVTGEASAREAALRRVGRLVVALEHQPGESAQREGSHLLEVRLGRRVRGAVIVRIVAVPDPAFLVFGPETFTRQKGAPVVVTRQLVVGPTAAAPYGLRLTGDGKDAPAVNAIVTLNGRTVVREGELHGKNAGRTGDDHDRDHDADAPPTDAVVKAVQLTPGINVLTVELRGAPGSQLTVALTATDVTRPIVAITAPVERAVTRLSTTDVAGTVEDETVVRVLVDGQAAGLLNRRAGALPGYWRQDYLRTATPLASEGLNTIVVRATDAAGLAAGASRVLIRDSEAPVVTLTTPAEPPAGGPAVATNQPTVLVSGTVQDRTKVTASVNGQPLAVAEVPGGFTGEALTTAALTGAIALAEGANVLTLTATDEAGNARSVVRTVTLDTRPPLVALATPAEGAITKEQSVALSGTVTDDGPVTLTVNGAAVPVDAAGHFDATVPLPAEGTNTLSVVATDAAGNSAGAARTLTRDTQAPVIAVAEPADGAAVTAASVLVRGTVSDATPVTVAVNGSPVTVASTGAMNGFAVEVALVVGANTIGVTATDAAGNASSEMRLVTRSDVIAGLPPDPVTVAPALDRTVATTVAEATSFLYSGSSPIQTGVAPGTIDAVRASVVRGRVLARDGTPLPGVAVSILDHPELGQTKSRADGWYDLAVNGGGIVTLDYQMSGYLPAQRQAQAAWQDYRVVGDVALVPLDPAVTAISDPATATAIQVAQGTPSTDANGTRRATLLFTPGTQAVMTLPNGTTQPLTTLNVRASEYTVGASGPKAMPGPLPPTTAYTYAVELSVDEAQAAGAASVTFSQPVPVYVDNFLEFPVGTIVPSGYYDRREGRWIGSRDGRVLRIVSVANGSADLDADGDNVADSPSALASLGVTPAEQRTLATRYAAGASLWRVPVDHFSPWDFNLPYAPDTSARGPDVPPPSSGDGVDSDDGTKCPGCTIEVENRILGERIPIVGVPFALNYRSNRVPGWAGTANRIVVTLSGNSVPSSLQRIDLSITIAGRSFFQSFPAVPNLKFTYQWDGVDVYGRPASGGQTATVRVSYAYKLVYYATASGFSSSWARFGPGVPLSSARSPAYAEVLPYTQWQVKLGGVWDARAQALGGWTLDVHHAYDPGAKILYLGTGDHRAAQAMGALISTVAGTGELSSGGDGGPATAARLGNPSGVVVAPDGSVYVTDWGSRGGVRRIATDGVMTTVAGGGSCPFGCSDGPATQVPLNQSFFLTLGPDGALYISEWGAGRIRRVGADGLMTTVAGPTIDPVSASDGVLASHANLGGPHGIAFGPDGLLYITEPERHRVRIIGSDGRMYTVVGTGVRGRAGDGGPATAAQLSAPTAIAFGPDGALYITDAGNQRVRRVGTDGIITTIAGTGIGTNSAGTFEGLGGFSGDGGPATQAQLWHPYGIAVGPDGTVYVTTLGDHRVRRIGTDGIITTVAGNGTAAYGGDGMPAKQTSLQSPGQIAVGPDGTLYIADSHNHRLRSIAPTLPGYRSTELSVSSPDGAEVYQFTATGRHLRTVDALTGTVLYRFAYDVAGRLTTVTDRDGRVAAIQRDDAGNPTAIITPSGERTSLTTDENGYLASATDPAGNVTRAQYAVLPEQLRPGGSLGSLTDPRGNASLFSYAGSGELVADRDPTGATKRLPAALEGTARTVSLTSALGRVATFRTEPLPAGGTLFRRTAPDGTVSTTVLGVDGTETVTAPDGTVTTDTLAGDPRFRMMSPVLRGRTIRLPSGLTMRITGGRMVDAISFAQGGAGPLPGMRTLRDSTIVNGRKWVSHYDVEQRTLTSTAPSGRTTTTRTNALGRVVQTATPGIASVSFGYDAQGNLTTSTQGDRSSTFTHDGAGRPLSATDALGRRTSFQYDAAGQLTRQTFANSLSVLFGYDANGNLTSVTPSGRPAHTFTYDARNLVTSYTPPAVAGTGATTYAYDADRNLTHVGRPGGSNIDMAYDAGGRLATLTTPRGSATYSYTSSTGQLNSIAAPGGITTSYSYDGGLVTSERASGLFSGNATFVYDANFRMTGLTVQVGPTGSSFPGFLFTDNYRYDQDGLLTQAIALGIDRSPQNGLITGTSLSSVATARTYNAFGEPASDVARFAGDALLQRDYTRDQLGRITRVVETVQGQSTTYDYAYDEVGRLTQVSTNGAVSASYAYDANGNRTSLTTPNGVETGTYDAQDRLIAYGGASYSYTPSGELLTKTVGGATTHYDYDALGNLLGVTLPDGERIDYVVDGLNQRIGKRVNGALVQGFFWAGGRLLAETNGSGQPVSSFVYGTRGNVPDYMTKGGATYRFVTDHLGSVRLVVNAATGVVQQRIDYDEFGRVTQNTNPGFQPFGFAGGLYDDETRLVRFGARDYDPFTGRWSTKDPLIFGGRDANLYRYVAQDPINLSDPLGLAVPPSIDTFHRADEDRYRAGLDLRHYTAARNLTKPFSRIPDLPLPGLVLVKAGAVAGANVLGLLVELGQQRAHMKSAHDPQDYLSNLVGSLSGIVDVDPFDVDSDVDSTDCPS